MARHPTDRDGSDGIHAPMPSGMPRIGPNLSPVGKEPFEPQQNAGNRASDPDFTAMSQDGSESANDGPRPMRPDSPQGKKKKPRSRRFQKLKPPRRLTPQFSFSDKKPGPIVPKGTIAGHALVLVIAIMSFLAALTVAAVSIISDATRDWQSDISRGATIQIRQIEGVDMEGELAKAIGIARQTRGISSATALTSSESNALLEPWLGLDITFDDLPVPRLIELTIDDPSNVDFDSLSKALQEQVPGAILDNHRFWVERLRSMAETAIFIGFTIMLLVITATVLTVVFATRSAMAGNKETIEVLHFVGASNKFIAGEFQRKFFTLGFQGALAGGGVAVISFLIIQLLLRAQEGSAALDQMQALLGVVQLGTNAYLGTFALIVLIAVFTAITTRLTVMNTLKKLS
ncbi:cell division protein FtsX [Cohaesibacter haloalkalitolerans]|uniref:cell division protein FtsX n=1 Tax=Cohaesibacter haloalkalitolerans TaxID=1162980 RepID=UPI001FE20D9B|nr:ABC transporter permease [Cohaesibacter haloalkalitolerans]